MKKRINKGMTHTKAKKITFIVGAIALTLLTVFLVYISKDGVGAVLCFGLMGITAISPITSMTWIILDNIATNQENNALKKSFNSRETPMKKSFYVLFNEEESALYVDRTCGLGCLTEDPLMAERYSSVEDAKGRLKYFKNPEKWSIKKVTINIVDV